jgi:hypothetical protein
MTMSPYFGAKKKTSHIVSKVLSQNKESPKRPFSLPPTNDPLRIAACTYPVVK